ncbi:MAG: NAD(P)-dependent glycerol-3-phosphate dehydrogenase [Oscillospiraceae bacterium]|nr:NAD(P)-dependent glycerol-3-phosphate dehydrogenase [Oscillospiraceae bacterium]
MKITVLGAGAFGVALANTLVTKGADVALWGRNNHIATAINNHHAVPWISFQGIKLNKKLEVIQDLKKAISNAEMVIIAIPSNELRNFLSESIKNIKSFKDSLSHSKIISVSKGIEENTCLRMTEVIIDVLGIPKNQVGVLSGPNLAVEIAKGLPCQTIVSSYENLDFASQIRDTFQTNNFRVYLNQDIIGVEYAGAMKNIIAIAAGFCAGLELGDNTMGGLITRGAIEIERFALELGAKRDIIKSISLTGDLITTCVSPGGRNRRAGEDIAKGKSVLDAINNNTLEGAHTVNAIHQLAEKHNIYTPICSIVYEVLFNNVSVESAKTTLLAHQEEELEYPEPSNNLIYS